MSPPEISARDLSYHEAQAGIAAREAAAASGGDPAQLRAFVAAAGEEAQAIKAPTAIATPMLKGHPLRGDDLLVSLCFELYLKAFGADPRRELATNAPEDGLKRLQAIAALAFIYTQPFSAYDMLDRAADAELSKEDALGWARDFRNAAVDFAGEFGEHEIAIIGQHVINIARRMAAPEEEPGK